MFRMLINGFCMALADSVPGVSGGTIALVLGFYDSFIGAVHDLIYGNAAKKKAAVLYLLKLGVGWAVGMVLAVLVLTAFFERNIYAVSSLFLGFVLCSVPIIVREEWRSIRGKWYHLGFSCIGLAAVVLLSCFGNTGAYELSRLSVGSALYLFAAGAVAICAMFLPGISGSTVLLIFGVYMPILNGVKEILHLNFSYVPAVFVFGVGVLFGAVCSVKGIQSCLARFRSQTVYTIIGMLLGSLYAIVMGPVTVNAANEPLLPTQFRVLWFLLGIVLLLLIQTAKHILNQKTKA